MEIQEKQILKELGQRIKALRVEKKMTQAELAALVNKDQQSIQRLEAGRVNPGYLYLREIMIGLEWSMIEVLNVKKTPDNPD